MVMTMNTILHPGHNMGDPSFPNAPDDWKRDEAEKEAEAMGLEIVDDHWEVIRVLQGSYAEDQTPPLRRLHDALEARFGRKGGLAYLYQILPGGPIYQGARLAGYSPPSDSLQPSFGSMS